MPTLTVKVSHELHLRLDAEASALGVSKSHILRDALERQFVSSSRRGQRSLLDRMEDLVGTVNGPSDLSSNARHLDGYGQ